MPKIEIPDHLRIYVAMLKKHHFWLLSLALPLIVLPLLFIANGHLSAGMASARSKIDSHLSVIKRVSDIQAHPNEEWSTEITAASDALKRETFAEWTRFWESQKPLRKWPESLGNDFVTKAEALKPDGQLPPAMLDRYHNGVLGIVQKLPEIMGSANAMFKDDPEARVGAVRARTPAHLIVWSPDDQMRLLASFQWDKKPSTAKALLAQEELWVYQLLCKLIAETNKSAAGAYNAPITRIEQLAVSYPAAEDNPGGNGRSRILTPVSQQRVVQSEDSSNLASNAVTTEPISRPPNPRFGSGSEDAPKARGSDGEVKDPLRNWIYVDLDGKPLSANELSASNELQAVHLMPFVIRAVIDQRSLDTFLIHLATAIVPIDVRQVRINVDSALGTVSRGGTEQTGTDGVAVRPNDMQVELRGTVCLATLPNATLIGLPKEETVVEGAAEAPASPLAQPRRSQPSPKPATPVPTDVAEPVPASVPTDVAEPVPASVPTDVAEPVPASVPTDAAEPVPAPVPTDAASHNPQPHLKRWPQTTQGRAFCWVSQEDFV